MPDKLKKTIEVYERIAERFTGQTDKRTHDEELNYFISLLPEKKALDAGCGSGKDVKYLVEHGVKTVGIDLSEKLLELGRKKIKAKFLKMDLRKLEFPKASFGGVLSMVSLIHLPRGEVLSTLKEFNRVLCDKGILFLVVYEGKGEVERKEEIYGGLPRYYTLFTLKEIELMLEKAGFEIIRKIIRESDWKNKIRLFAVKK